MSGSIRILPKQKRRLVELVNADNIMSLRNTRQRWNTITMELNAMGGAIKTSYQWRKVYSKECYKRSSFKSNNQDKKIIRPVESQMANDTRFCDNRGNTCKDTDEDLKLFKEDGCYMQIIRVIAQSMYHENKTEIEALVRLCKGQSQRCRKIPLWHDFRANTIIKLNHLFNANDLPLKLSEESRMKMSEWLLFDTILVHQDVNVIEMTETGKIVDKGILVLLFELVVRFGVENLSGDELADAWSALAVAYNKATRACTPMLLQRRWYQTKLATRLRFTRFWTIYQGDESNLPAAKLYTPTPLQIEIVWKFKSLILEPFVLWDDLVKTKRVILREQFEQIALNRRAKENANQPVTPNFEVVVDENKEKVNNNPSTENEAQFNYIVKQEPETKTTDTITDTLMKIDLQTDNNIDGSLTKVNINEEIEHLVGRIKTDYDLEDKVTVTDIEKPAIDMKILQIPIVYTTKLDHMNLPITLASHFKGQNIIDNIYKRSKPVYINRIKKPPKKISRVKLSSALFKKPCHRTYEVKKIINNPDYNTALKNLRAAFYNSGRNISMLKSCKLVTIDVSKEFEKQLDNGILYCTNDGDEESVENVPLVSLKTHNKYYKVVSETENNTQNQKSLDKQVAKQSSKRAKGALNSLYTPIAADTLNAMLNVLSQQTTREPEDFNIKYCCWARQKINVKHMQKKHNCPYPSCLCCCKELLKDFFANTLRMKSTKSADKSLPRIDEMESKDIKSANASDSNIEPIQTISDEPDVIVADFTHKPVDHNKIVRKTCPAKDLPKPIILAGKNSVPFKGAIKTVAPLKKRNSKTTCPPNDILYNSGEEDDKLPPRINIKTNVIIRMPPKSYFDFPDKEEDDESINIGKNEILLTTTKIPPNLKQFSEFRRQVWRDLNMFNGLRLDIEPNGQVTLSRRPRVFICNDLIMQLQDKIDKFYEQTKNTNTGVPTEKYIETKQTEAKINKNTCPGNFNENNNNIETGISVTSIKSNSFDMHMKQVFEEPPCLLSPQALHDAIKSKVGNIVSSSLSLVTCLSELDYAYYRNGLFFVFDFNKGSLRPMQVVIKNPKKARREAERAKKQTSANHSILQNILEEDLSLPAVSISKNRNRKQFLKIVNKCNEQKRNKNIKHSNEQSNLIKIAPKPSITPITISNESANQPFLIHIPPVTVLSTSLLGNDGNVNIQHEEDLRNDGNVNIKHEESLSAVNLADSLFDVEEEYILGE